MKSFLTTLLATILLIGTPIVAQASNYPLTATQTPTLISVIMSELPADQSTYELYDGDSTVKNLPSTAPWTRQALGGQIVWELTGAQLVANKTYTFHVKRLPKSTDIIQQKLEVTDPIVLTFGTTTSPTTTLLKSFSIDPTADRTVTVLGKIDTSLYPSTNNLKIDFYWSNTGTDKDGPSNAHLLSSGVNGQSQIAADGSYTLVVTDLTPSATYYFKQAISTSGGTTPVETKIGTFTAQKGYLAPGSVGESLDFNSRSYHLLAPWPGLSVLMDPDLCAQKKADGSVPQDAICDVNGFLNFAFKLLIGITAVVLVLRLMYEGYQYVVTDVPFLKASAKSDFKTALLGLLLALSAYIILNTINPKLVNNRITIDSVEVRVLQLPDNADTRSFSETEDIETNLTKGSTNRGFSINGTFDNPIPTNPQLKTFTTNLKSKNATITKIVTSIDAPNSKKNSITFYGSDGSVSPAIIVNIGANGYSLPGQNSSGDKKTPIGTFTVTGDIRLAKDQNSGALAHVSKSKDGTAYNFGAGFINTGAMTAGERAIGIHSNKENKLKVTNGCIRMYNQDLVLVAQFIKPGTKITIQKI